MCPDAYMPRPVQSPRRKPLNEEEIEKASYEGSPEHKCSRWWGGLPLARIGPDGDPIPRPRKQHTTICFLVTLQDRERATDWVRKSLRAGQCKWLEGDKTYPKHIWYKDETGQYWFGYAINQIAGTYKGWPIEESEKFEVFD